MATDALRRAQMSTVAEFVSVMKDVDLRPTQFAVLTIIKENPGVRQTEVCAALGIQKANFVPLLNELQRLQREVAVLQAAVGSRPTTIAVPIIAKGETDEAMR